MRYQHLARRLRDLGCDEMHAGKGSHRIWYNPLTEKVTSIPDWSARDLTLGTVRAVI
ncbi:MAG: hypothetical protein CVU38_00475 [Chloroflexi bacterium HGW-Chloroflexi-1]|nr:MAG: hypothetical protein CVU38_00475 [Chloroflexi bacterium HGW-Chloroflexi-1]